MPVPAPRTAFHCLLGLNKSFCSQFHAILHALFIRRLISAAPSRFPSSRDKDSYEQDRQYTYILTLWSVHITILVKNTQYYKFFNPAWKTRALHIFVCGIFGPIIFFNIVA